MNVITLRDYAKQNNISYEAVRKQVVRYADELGDHIIKDGRQQFLDEEAVAFLDSKRQKNPVAIIQMDKDAQIKSLRNEKEALLIKIASIQDELLQEKNKVAQLQEAEKTIARLEANNEVAEAERRKVEEQNAVLQQELERKTESERALAERAVKSENRLSEATKEFEDKEYLMKQEIEQLRGRKWYQLLFKKNKE